jgi:hypothetical protein
MPHNLARHDGKHSQDKKHSGSAKMAHHELESSAVAGSASMYHGKKSGMSHNLGAEGTGKPVIYKGVFTRGPGHLVNETGHHKLPKQIMEGLLNVGLVNETQRQYVDGLITHPSAEMGDKASSREPIRAEGQYVGAPTLPKGQAVEAYNPKTKRVPGHKMPVAQSSA